MNEVYLGQCAFALYVLIILGGGVLAVTAANLVRAMLGLVVALFGVAGLYLLLLAEFVALMQILIYVGAVTVLIFFAIMLTRVADGAEAEGPGERGVMRAIPAFLVPAGILVPFLAVYGATGFPTPKNVSPDQLGAGLLGPYTLAFELISVVLLAAMAGAVLLAFEKRRAA